MTAIRLLQARSGGADAVLCRPSDRMGGGARISISRASSVKRVLVAGEPGGGEPAFRARLEEGWGAQGHRGHGHRRHRRLAVGRMRAAERHASRRARLRPCRTDRSGNRRGHRHGGRRARANWCSPICSTRPRRCLRFRTRDHVEVWTSPCACGRTAPRVRCIGRTDDMLIVRGVNVFPSAIREVVSEFVPAVSGHILVKPAAARREAGAAAARRRRTGARAAPRSAGLAEAIRDRIARRAGVHRGSRAGAIRQPGAQRIQVQTGAALEQGGSPCRNFSPRAFTTSRSSAPTGRPRSISGRACSACPSSSSSPISTRRPKSHLYFDPGDGRLITVFTDETRKADPRRTPTEPGCVHHIAFSVSRATFLQAVQAPRRARDQAQRRQGPRLHGFDLFHRSARPADRARLLPLRAARRLHPCRCAVRGPQASAWRAATTTSPKSISPTRSRQLVAARGTRRCRRTARRRTPTERDCNQTMGGTTWLQ